MANRAFLYSDDRPDAWDRPDAEDAPREGYYDSRWTIPLAWFFFFKPDDVRLVDVTVGGSHWQEVRLSAEKGSALELFGVRKRLLMSFIGDRAKSDTIDRFLANVGGRMGRYLLINPDQVLGGSDDRDETHAGRIAEILAALGDDSCPAELIRRITLPYVGDFSPDQDRFESQIFGCTYS